MLETPSAPRGPSALSFSRVSKVYRVYASPRDRLWEAITGRPRHTEVRALREVSGAAPRGAVLGLIGENGSGKSTLLKILAGTTTPTSGEISRNGRIASILELGSSFHPEVTGRRNVFLQAALTGLSRKEVEEAMPEIEAFAELGAFFDQPVKTYSSGMQMRLAFAVATAVLPDVVILDEALAVGDGHFQKKCVDRIFELKASGRTILFCSHAMYYVSTLCEEALWLRAGEIAAAGDAQRVVQEYEKYLAKKEDAAAPAAETARSLGGTHGRIVEARLVSADGTPTQTFRPSEAWAVEIAFVSDAPDRALQLHVGVATRDQVNCFSADSRVDGVGPFRGAARYRARVTIPSLPLAKGEFVVHLYLTDELALAIYDARTDLSFHVEAERWKTGLFEVSADWRVTTGEARSGEAVLATADASDAPT